MGLENAYKIKIWDISSQKHGCFVVLAIDFDRALEKARAHASYNNMGILGVELIGVVEMY